ncbi:TetR/AcrR family transcriptional regulator [Nitriliruptor alkaliphilus]|uniref:TetR/AcrR family transcriptional regulator n=1 Tax=Nitriliruptor alkaliphilus TaxID=427918 RepID=UPI00069876DA|nr:WHG domain-containing protein [Nitriliruptor alkaliphilus]
MVAEGRRDAARRRTMAELDAAALAEVHEHGAVALSLRRVARRMGMSPAGLYRYVDSREGLLTRLIAGGYEDLADHLAVATGAEPRPAADRDRPAPDPPVVAAGGAALADRVRAVALAYRHWGVTHPQEFGLLFGDPIPGYAAPPGGVTVEAMGRVGSALGAPIVEAWLAGRLRTLPLPDLDPEQGERLAEMAKVADRELPPEVSLSLLAFWGRLHGQVSLEVFGHHRWLFPDGCEPLFRADLEAMLRDLGVVAEDAEQPDEDGTQVRR